MWHALRPHLLVMVVELYFRTWVVNSNAKLLKIYCNNVITIFFSKNDKYYKGAKQTELKYLSRQKQILETKSVNGIYSKNLMIVNPLMKGQPPKILLNMQKE